MPGPPAGMEESGMGAWLGSSVPLWMFLVCLVCVVVSHYVMEWWLYQDVAEVDRACRSRDNELSALRHEIEWLVKRQQELSESVCEFERQGGADYGSR